MPDAITLRAFAWSDYEAVIALWRATGLGITVSD